MTARRPGRLLLRFNFVGVVWEVRLVPQGHQVLDYEHETWGITYFEERVIYLRSNITLEQQQSVLSHELQHLVEEHACVDHQMAAGDEQESEHRTDRLGAGWLYLIRDKAVTNFLQKHSS